MSKCVEHALTGRDVCKHAPSRSLQSYHTLLRVIDLVQAVIANDAVVPQAHFCVPASATSTQVVDPRAQAPTHANQTVVLTRLVDWGRRMEIKPSVYGTLLLSVFS